MPEKVGRAMPYSSHTLPSPCSSEFDPLVTVSPKSKPATPAAKMLKIHSLLNHANTDGMRDASISPPPTPAYTQASSTCSTPTPQTPNTLSNIKKNKLIKDAAIFTKGESKTPINYPPFECTEDTLCLNAQDREELARQHQRFAIFPAGTERDGLIVDYPRHIPYSSDKKTFYGKTNRDAFEVFQYTFKMPSDDSGKEFVVMWDYQVGLVRITPFFKALKHNKTTPAKALNATAGLKELSHSITGGALAAQGYWMPYSCARAVCLTFCYKIRWALTPIFGPSFVRECLRPEHHGYEKYKISAEVIRCAELEAEGLRSTENSPSPTAFSSHNTHYGGAQEIPRSVPASPPQYKELRPRPTFKMGSPFESDSERSEREYTYRAPVIESPELSPKTTRSTVSPSWTSINRRQEHATPPPPPNNTPFGSLSQSLLTEPRTLPTTSWRAFENAVTAPPRQLKMPTGAHDKHRVHQRRISTKAYEDADYVASASDQSSESDDVDIVLSPVAKKRQRREDTPGPESASTSTASTPATKISGKSKKYNAADARAAQWLLNLSMRDAQLAAHTVSGRKRKVSMV